MPPPATVETDAASLQTDLGRWSIVGESDRAVFLQRDSAGSPRPTDWKSRLEATLAEIPGVAIVGAKRLTQGGETFSMGEFVVHPKGFHHHGQGASGEAFRFPEEVDAVTGGVLAIDADALRAAGGVTELQGELGALNLCLSVRAAGGRCVVVPDVTIQDECSLDPTAEESRGFRRSWGFDWQAADLDAVRDWIPASGLLWNPRFHGRAMPFEKYRHRPGVHWNNYENVDTYRQRADHLVTLIGQVLPSGRVLDLGCGDGLFSHLLATNGCEVIGIDPEPEAIEQARKHTAQHAYPGPPPKFSIGHGESLDIPGASMHLAVMLDVIEHLPNPVTVLRESRRVLLSGGGLLITTPQWQFGASSDACYHGFEYTMDELTRQVAAIGFEITQTGKIGGAYRDLIVIARRTASVVQMSVG